MRLMASALLLATAALGCGGEAFIDPTLAGVPAQLEGPGVYTVPAAPGVAFALGRVSVAQADGDVSLYYELPADLVGRKQDVALKGAPDSATMVRLSGHAGTSTCTVAAALLRCEEHLSGVDVDVDAVRAALAPGDPRLAAAEAFAVDPIGVLSLPLPAAAEAVDP